MPQIQQAEKRVRQAEKRRLHNRARKSKMKTLIKNVYGAADKAQAEAHLKTAVSFIDKMSLKGIIHANNAARKKSSLTKFVNGL